MQYRNLGRSQLATAPLIFGGNVLGWTLDEKSSFDMLDAWLDAGFNMIDTADVYSKWVSGHAGGESETVLGRYFSARGNRDQFILASKVGMEMPGHGEGLTRQWIQKAIDDSLSRLQTDYLDVYFAHCDDDSTPLDETIAAFDRLVDEGKVRVLGASNHDGGRLTQALRTSADQEAARYEILQPQYNLYDRTDYERDLAPVCAAQELAVTPYFSLASGFLTGKYRQPSDAQGAARQAFVNHYFDERGLRILDALDAVAERFNTTPAAVSLAWLLEQPTVTAPIVSATTADQLSQLVNATELVLDSDAKQALADASRPT